MSTYKLFPILLLLIFQLCNLPEGNAQFPKLFRKKKTKSTPKISAKERWNYDIIDNAASPEGVLVAKATYSLTGEQKKLSLYAQTGELKHQYFYEKNDEALTKIRYWKSNEEKIKDYSEELDALGRVIKRIRYQPGAEILDITSWIYDSKGRVKQEVYYNDANQKVYEINYSYNDMQRSLKEEQHYLLEDEHYITAVELDEDFQPLSRSRYKDSGPLVDKVIYLRDDKGRLTEVEHYPDGKNLTIKEKYLYKDAQNKVIYSVFDINKDRMLEYAVFVYRYYKD